MTDKELIEQFRLCVFGRCLECNNDVCECEEIYHDVYNLLVRLSDGVIVPPCKVGDICYPLPRSGKPIVERKISRITFSKNNIIIGYYENDGQYRPPLRTRILGEDVFLTCEEAERSRQ